MKEEFDFVTMVDKPPVSNIARWALGDGHGLRLLNLQSRVDFIKCNVRSPQVWGRKNPTYSGYWPSINLSRVPRRAAQRFSSPGNR